MNHSISCKGRQLRLGDRTLVMGILNVTPDSFSDGGRYVSVDAAVAHAERMAEAGADLIDVGGESTRPAGPYGQGADPVSAVEEVRRTLPVLEGIASRIDLPISIDTTKAEVARQALNAGASMVNDISALRSDPLMARIVVEADVPIVLMHMKGTPKTMQRNPSYGDLIGEIIQFLAARRDAAESLGISREQIILDPGLGFAKRPGDNYEILARLSEFHVLKCPLLLGPSRKTFVGSPQNLPPEARLEGTLAALAFCVAGGVHILRVHDVREAVRAIRVAEEIVRARPARETAP